jgi:hypothetical protein
MGLGRPFQRRFTDAEVYDIRFGGGANEAKAEEYDCAPSTIARIRLGQVYKNLPMDVQYQAKAAIRKRNAGCGSTHARTKGARKYEN